MLLACSSSLFAQETETHSTLAVVQAGVQQSEDAPFVPADYAFLPGDFVYFTFQLAGFATQSFNRNEGHKISLKYELTPEDSTGVPLAEPISDSIQDELSSQDKNWMPKRRASFLLPSYVAAGEYRIHLVAKDVFGKSEISKDFPFRIGGVQIQHADGVNVQHFEFLRRESDREALQIPAYSPGDTVFARFDMAGFKLATGNSYNLDYGISVIQPNGKSFLDAPRAAELKASSFYPAQFLPGTIEITTPPNSAKGEYVLTLTVHDHVAKTQYQLKAPFSVE